MSVLLLVLLASVVLNVTRQLNCKADSVHDLEFYQNSIVRDNERLQNHRLDTQPPPMPTKQNLNLKKGPNLVPEPKHPVFKLSTPATQSSKRSRTNYVSNEKFNKHPGFTPSDKGYAPYGSNSKVHEIPVHQLMSTTQANYALRERGYNTESFMTSGKIYGNSNALEKSSYGSHSYGNSVVHHAYHHQVKPFLDFSPLFLALIPICLTIGAAAALALASVISNNNINNNNNNNNLQQQTQQSQQQQQFGLSYPYFILYNTTLQGISVIGKK